MMSSTAYQNSTIIINTNVGNVRDSYNNVVSDEKRQILEWLSPLAPRERHRAVSEGRMEGVGDWLLRRKEFEKWHRGEDKLVHPVLFCYGDPGVGKTYLSSLVIDRLCDAIGQDNVAVTCVYCDFHAHKDQSATGVLAALLKQLVAAVEPIPKEILDAFQRAKRTVDGRTLRLHEVRAMFVKSLSFLQRGFICIDALDEFPAKHRPELWGSLQHVVRECPNTRLFVTGRPHIREEVAKYFPGYPELAPIKPTEGDVRGYITMRLQNDSEPDAMDAELEAETLRIIPDRISEAFLLVSLTMDAVLEDATIHQRRQTLHRTTNGLGLDDAYSTTLGRIKEQKGNKVKIGMEALMWISRSERPLKAQELCHALAVEVGATDINADNVPSIRTLLNCTLGLVAIDEQTSTARLLHFTLQEYLTAHPNLFITCHSMMAEICLTYLNFQSICELSTALDTIPSTTPFLHYASCYWGFHARKEITESVKHLALRHLERGANHISADILLREETVNFLSWWESYKGGRPDIRGFTGLHCIAYMGIPEIGNAMVDLNRWDLNGRDSNGATPLIWAAKYGNYTLAKLLLEQRDIDPTSSDKHGLTPLIHAAKTGQVEVVELLLEREDVNPNSSDKSGQTPLSHAAESGHEGVVKRLLARGDVNSDLSDKSGRTPLSYAAGSGSEGIVKILMERGDVNPNSSNENGRTPLSHAAGYGNEEVVKLLLERGGVNPDLPDAHGQTPISLAAESGHEDVVKILLEQQHVNPDSPDEDGRTPLSYAAGSGSEGVVKILLQREDVNINSSDCDGETPLAYAAESGHEGVVKVLLERGDINADSSDVCGQTPLSLAAKCGYEGVVKVLLERRDINPAASDKHGRTPLSFAAESGNVRVVRMLLEREDVNSCSSDKSGRAPLSYAARSGHEGIVKILLERRDVNPASSDKRGRTPLSLAAGSGHEGVVEVLLERGDVNPDSPDKYGWTPLSYAAGRGYEGLVKILLERRGVNPDSSSKSGRTPLSYAARSGHEGLVKILLGRGDVNPDSSDKSGRTPLLHAARSGHESIVKIFLERWDVNPASWDKRGGTPLSFAAGSGNERVVKMLLERGDVNPDSSDENGWTPLSFAAARGHEGVVKILLEHRDVNPDSSSKSGRTPLSYAARSGHQGVVKMLLERGGANPNSLATSGRTPLSYAARSGHEGVVKMLLERGDANPDSSDRHGPTVPTLPLLAAPAGNNGAKSPSLEPSSLAHEISPNIDPTEQTSVPAASPSESVQFGQVSQKQGITSHPRPDVTEVISFPHSDKPPPITSQLVVSPSTSIPAATLTSDTAPDQALSPPPWPLKRHSATPPLLYPSKRQHFPS